MVTLEVLRAEMQKRLEVDKLLHSVDVRADTIDEALADAAVQLDSKTVNLQYEVVEKGNEGFLGFGKKPWLLRIYQNPDTIKKETAYSSDDLFAATYAEEAVAVKDSDGLYYIRHFNTQIMLKIVPPVGKGAPVELREVLDEARRQDTIALDENLIKKVVKTGTNGEYVSVGDYKHVSAGDVLISVDVSKDEMQATITVSPPSMSGAEASSESIIRCLKSQGVVAGFDEQKISEFVDNPVYNIPYQVASAVMPVDGHDAYIAYNFETDVKKLRAKISEDGNVDYKELNQIQNVVTGQALATKILPERGKGGKTIMGRYLEAKNGRDIQVNLGANTHFDKDGVTIVADCDGEVMLVNGKITVEPVKYLDAVNIKTGNITFLGSVVVKGSVDDGYNVKASGSIEINGSVGKCRIEADGDVTIRQGVFGKDECYIRSGKSLWAKFIQSSHVEVENNIIVNDSIMNSEVTAMKNIVLRGKKAQIIGGHLFATEEICAKNIGSPGGGTETVLNVGIDPRAKKQLEQLQEEQADLAKEMDNLALDIATLEQQQKIRRNLPQEKKENLLKFKKRHEEIGEQINELASQIEKIQEHLRELKAVGKVKCEGTVYSGVKVYVRDVLDEVKADVKGVTFYYDRSFIKRGEYEPPSMSQEEMNGDTTN
ncbi:MAG: FapA family protein [Treponema sp.]|nr:FapA family protein [Treponema sp.]